MLSMHERTRPAVDEPTALSQKREVRTAVGAGLLLAVELERPGRLARTGAAIPKARCGIRPAGPERSQCRHMSNSTYRDNPIVRIRLRVRLGALSLSPSSSRQTRRGGTTPLPLHEVLVADFSFRTSHRGSSYPAGRLVERQSSSRPAWLSSATT
jgi:hypothetical protein